MMVIASLGPTMEISMLSECTVSFDSVARTSVSPSTSFPNILPSRTLLWDVLSLNASCSTLFISALPPGVTAGSFHRYKHPREVTK